MAAVFATGSGAGGGHGADQGTMGRTGSQHLPGVTKQVAACKDLGPSTASVGQCRVWKLRHVSFPVPAPTPTTHRSGRWLQNNFSLPELQCFISDSQLTRDAALHLRLGDTPCCSTAPCGPPLGSALCGRRAFRGHPDFSGSAQRLLLLSWDSHLSSLGPNLHSPFHSIPYSFGEIESHI